LVLPVIVAGLVVVAILFARRRHAKGISTTTGPVELPAGPSSPPAGSRRAERGSHPDVDLERSLARWVAAGLLSEQQSAAIVAHEEARARPVTAPHTTVSRVPGRRVPVVAEALGYLGGTLALVGLALVVAQYWPDMALAGRLALSGAGAVVFLVAGALVHEEADPALARLRGFLWLLATAATALFASVLVTGGFETASTETVVLACSGAVAFESGLL
jgi:Predicted membrane protein (DUF2157)